FALSGVSRRKKGQPAGPWKGWEPVTAPAALRKGNHEKIIALARNRSPAGALDSRRRVEGPPAPNPSPIRRIDPCPSGAGVFFFAVPTEGRGRSVPAERPGNLSPHLPLDAAARSIRNLGGRRRRVGGPLPRDGARRPFVYVLVTTRSSRWIISVRPAKPRIEKIAPDDRPLILAASSAS